VKNQAGLSWKAVRRGSIFCAPACGGGCTYAAYRKACADAMELCHTLKGCFGGTWRFRVWENLGWWHEAISPCGRVRVSAERWGSFSAGIGERGGCGSRWHAHAGSPRQAVLKVVWKAEADLAKLGATFADLPKPVRSVGGRKRLMLGGAK
jgi:hypothetical protein